MKWIIYQFYFNSYLFSTLTVQSDKFPNIMKIATYKKFQEIFRSMGNHWYIAQAFVFYLIAKV